MRLAGAKMIGILFSREVRMKRHTAIALISCMLFLLWGAMGAGASEVPKSAEKELQSCPALNEIYRQCLTKKMPAGKGTYCVPQAWLIDPEKGEKEMTDLAKSGNLTKPVKIGSFYETLGKVIASIAEYKAKHPVGTVATDLKTGEKVVAMNALPRVISMYDHDQNGYIGSKTGSDITLNGDGRREMGTFIKNIMLLPYLKALGYNTIHFQPITEIGVYGRKGNLGSPFAIRDPFHIDSNLADPLFEGSVNEQYKAFLEAAHALNMKVVQEVIPRTVSIDSKILEQYPSFGYWVKEGTPRRMPDYYNSSYDYQTADGLRRFKDRASFEQWFQNEYKKKIYGGKYQCKDLIDVTKTDPEYTGFFMPPPDLVKREPSGKLIGCYFKIDGQGKKIKGEIDAVKRSEVFPAFCDTPFEIQPFWSDVTYLRLYDNVDGSLPMVGPLSFVTAKFFKDVEPSIEKRYRNQPVWDMIGSYFSVYKKMGADGFVLDMGHALPEDLKSSIRNVLPCIWEENLGAGFDYLSTHQGVLTGLVFAYCMASYSDKTEMKLYEDDPEKAVNFYKEGTKKLFREVAKYDIAKGRMFGSADNYNTKRIGETPATRELSKAPLRPGTSIPDFTEAPVNKDKARKLTLLYYTLFRIISEKEGAPFITNTVFGTEFVADSTINVGLSTHIKEAGQFYEYMSEADRKAHPDAPRLLLLSKPERLTGEWTSDRNILREMLSVNSALREMKPLLEKDVHMQVLDEAGAPDILCIRLSDPSGKSQPLTVACNLNLEKEQSFTPAGAVTRYYLNRPPAAPEEGKKGAMTLPAGAVTVFTSMTSVMPEKK